MITKRYCACGCGGEVVWKDRHKYDKDVRFIHGHNHKGKKYGYLYGCRANEERNKRAKLCGKNHPNFGKVGWARGLTIENDERIRKKSEKSKQTLRERYKLGILRANKGAFKKGHIPSNKGKKMPDKHNKILSDARIKGLREGRIIPWHKGKTGVYSNERLKRLKEERAQRVLPMKDSSIEVKMQNYLRQLGIEFFTHQYMKEIEHAYQCDIFIPSRNMVIECDGDYWHKYPVGKEIDHIRTKELIEKGFKVLRLWEFEIKSMDIDKFKEKLNEIE